MPAETVTVVTGAASGIGRATVEHLTRIGGRVVAVDRSAESMDWLDMRSTCAVAGDVTDEATNDAAVAAAQERFGGLDAAFLNAGLSVSGPLETLDLARFDECLDVNLRAVVLGLRAVVPALRQRGGGAVVVNASVTALGGYPGQRRLSGSDPDRYDPPNRERRPGALRGLAPGCPAAAVGERGRSCLRGRVSAQPTGFLRHRRRVARRRRSHRRERAGAATPVGSGRSLASPGGCECVPPTSWTYTSSWRCTLTYWTTASSAASVRCSPTMRRPTTAAAASPAGLPAST